MYRQESGAGMGTDNSCGYSDNAMNALDEKVHDKINGPPVIPILFARFRDDIYIPWIHGIDMLQSFLLWLNEFHPNIKFTMSNPSTEGTEFLETYVYIKNGNLCTKSYSKPCDSHAFLIPSSCHPTHTIKIFLIIPHIGSSNCQLNLKNLKNPKLNTQTISSKEVITINPLLNNFQK